MKLDEFLMEHKIPFDRMLHEPATTANPVAECLPVPGLDVAMSVLLRTTPGFVLTVLPATFHVDPHQIRRDRGEEQLEMACEEEVEQIFPDCAPGSMPPFGSLYHLRTIVDEHLTGDEKIVFDAQSHEEAIRMAYRD